MSDEGAGRAVDGVIFAGPSAPRRHSAGREQGGEWAIFGAVLNAAQIVRGGYFREQSAAITITSPKKPLTGSARARHPREQREDESRSKPGQAQTRPPATLTIFL